MVDLGIPLLASPQHVVESVPDLFRGLYVLQLHVNDVYTGVVVVKNFLQPLFGCGGHRFPLPHQHIVDGALAHHQAQSSLGGVLERASFRPARVDGAARRLLSGVIYGKQKVGQVLDVVLDHHGHVDDIQVPADHQSFIGESGDGAGVRSSEP